MKDRPADMQGINWQYWSTSWNVHPDELLRVERHLNVFIVSNEKLVNFYGFSAKHKQELDHYQDMNEHNASITFINGET